MSFTDSLYSEQENKVEQTSEDMFGAMDEVIQTSSMKASAKASAKKEATNKVVVSDKDALKLKLKTKIQQKKNKRGKKEKLHKYTFDLFTETKKMMAYVEQPHIKKLPILQKAHAASKVFPKLYEANIAIVKAVVQGEMNLQILEMMLKQRERIVKGEVDKDTMDEHMGYYLFNKYKKDKKQ